MLAAVVTHPVARTQHRRPRQRHRCPPHGLTSVPDATAPTGRPPARGATADGTAPAAPRSGRPPPAAPAISGVGVANTSPQHLADLGQIDGGDAGSRPATARSPSRSASAAPTSRYSHPTSSHARPVASNFATSRGLRRSTGRQSTTTAEPSARRAKKSGACDTRLARLVAPATARTAATRCRPRPGRNPAASGDRVPATTR